MEENPYRIPGPAVVSFSGGRTSAYMLHEIVRAYDGQLPDDILVCFANTGKERGETLDFVHACAQQWGVSVRWLEWRDGRPPQSVEVTYETASRRGEPFEGLILNKGFVPNAVMRFCTIELKIRTINRFLTRTLGWKKWVTAVGLRYDEGWRVMKALERNASGKERSLSVMPLAKAKVTKADVMDFWARQPFDLGLRNYEGNCDLCFLKAKSKLQALMRENPGMADWWVAQEAAVRPDQSGARFITERSYAELLRDVEMQGYLPFDEDDDHDAECGLYCAGD